MKTEWVGQMLAVRKRHTSVPHGAVHGLFILLIALGLSACSPSATPTTSPPAEQTAAAQHVETGRDALKNGNPDQAIQELEKAATMAPTSVEALFQLGNAYTDKEQFEKAIEMFKKVVELDPKYADGYSNLGVAYYRNGQMNKAVESFEKAVDLAPNDAEIRYNLGGALAQVNRLDDAVASFNKALSLNPNLPQAYLGLGSVYKLQGKNSEAIKALNRFLELSDDAQWRAYAKQLLTELQGSGTGDSQPK